MTISDFVLNHQEACINQWLIWIKEANLNQHENTILECANYYNLITINHNASFNDNNIINI